MLRTTNIIIHTDSIDFCILNNQYQLFKYPIPTSFRDYSKYRDKNAYPKLHNSYKEQIDAPFYFYTYDKPIPALYTIFEKGSSPKEWKLEFLNECITPEKIEFHQIDLHILLKILMANYFYNEIEQSRRICQGEFYVLGEGKGIKFTAVQLLLKHYPRNSSECKEEFQIIPKAQWIIKQDKKYINDKYVDRDEYFEEVIRDGMTYFRQLRTSQVLQFKATQEKDIFTLPTQQTRKNLKLKKADLNWHSDEGNQYRNTRGFIVYTFQRKFVEYLNRWGVMAEAKQLNIDEPFKSKVQVPEASGYGATGLPIKELKTIYVYDNRFKNENNQRINSIAVQTYCDFYQDYYGKELCVNFAPITENEFRNDRPLLILQDYTGKDFACDQTTGEAEGLLARAGFLDDPKELLYRSHRTIPKQTINVNPNDADKYHVENYMQYFNYDLPDLTVDTTLKYWWLRKENKRARAEREKIEVCFNELFLKDLILNKKPVSCANYTLPCFPEWSDLVLPLVKRWNDELKDLIFIHQNTLLYIEENIIHLISPYHAEYQKLRSDILTKYGIQWNDIVQRFREKYYLYEKTEDEIEDKLKKAYFIITKKQIIEIEELEERILPNYEAIEKKKAKGDVSARGQEEVTGTQGIWYHPEEQTYSIGSAQAPDKVEARAKKLRRFDIYKGEKSFNQDLFLELMAVQFVRNKQYTVYPYPFDLIRLYCENERY